MKGRNRGGGKEGGEMAEEGDWSVVGEGEWIAGGEESEGGGSRPRGPCYVWGDDDDLFAPALFLLWLINFP